MATGLSSWTDGAARSAITAFVERVTTDGGPDYVPPAERVAVFDNDGTLWTEKPMPIQLDFTLRRFAEMAAADPALREQQPWKACYERDFGWLGAAMVKHYHGDDADMMLLMDAIPQGLRGDDRGGLRRRGRGLLRDGDSPDPGAALPVVRLPADGRAAALSRGERLHHLHRLGR